LFCFVGTECHNKTLNRARNVYIKKAIYKCEDDSEKYWNLVNNLLGCKKKPILPDFPPSILVNKFNEFFSEKIVKIRESISSTGNADRLHPLYVSQTLSSFGQVTGADLVFTLRTMNFTSLAI
jgi:hypothetical protein